MGVLAALEEMGFGTCFDHVAGSSAGALNGAYFITGQARFGVETYVHHLSTRRFVNPLRLTKQVDVDYLIDHVLKRMRPLHLARLQNAPTTLHIALTDFLEATPSHVTNRTPGIDLWEAFRATAALPILFNQPVKVGARCYVDGGLRDRVPLRRVIEAGCRLVVVALTRPLSHRSRSVRPLLQAFCRQATRHYSPALKQAVFQENVDYNRTMALLSTHMRSPAAGSPRILVIAPRERRNLVRRTTINPRQLMRCARQARADAWRAFGLTPPPKDNPFHVPPS
jgi:predicted acylesterase/phospholipase RssA